MSWRSGDQVPGIPHWRYYLEKVAGPGGKGQGFQLYGRLIQENCNIKACQACKFKASPGNLERSCLKITGGKKGLGAWLSGRKVKGPGFD